MVGIHQDDQNYTGNTRVAYLKIIIQNDFDVQELVAPVNRSPNEDDIGFYDILLAADRMLRLPSPPDYSPDYACLNLALKKGRLPPIMGTYHHADQQISDRDLQRARDGVAAAKQVLVNNENPFNSLLDDFSHNDACPQLLYHLSDKYQLGWLGVGNYYGLNINRGVSYIFHKGSEKSVRHLNNLTSDLLEKNGLSCKVTYQLNQMRQEILRWINSP